MTGKGTRRGEFELIAELFSPLTMGAPGALGLTDDAAIIETCRNVELKLKAGASPSARSTRITVRLKDGREFVRARDSFKGMPEEPLNIADVRCKFMRLAAGLGEAAAERLFERLENMDTEGRFSVA